MATQALINELMEKMPTVPKPPENAAHDWSEFEVQLYFSSGGCIKPKTKGKAKAAAPAPAPIVTTPVSAPVPPVAPAPPVSAPDETPKPAEPPSPATPASPAFSTQTRKPFPKKDVIERKESAPPAHVLPKVVYIEHTDAYQIVYNTNYLSFCLHCIQDFYGFPLLLSLLKNSGIRMNVIHMDGMRCLLSGIMGDHLSVFTTVAERTTDTLTWYGACEASGGGTILADTLFTVGFFNAEGVQVPIPAPILECSHPEGKVILKGVLRKRSPPPGPDARLSCFPATAWLDCVDITGCLDPSFVLKLFERGRTNYIGGGEGLKHLLDCGIKCVVYRIEDVHFYPAQGPSFVGSKFEVRTRGALDKESMVFHQSIWLPGAPSPCAEGVVVCVIVDAVTGEKVNTDTRPDLRRIF